MDASNAKRNQQVGLAVLEHTLGTAQCLPRRTFKDAAAFATYLQDEGTLIFAGLEQRLQRPHENAVQRAFFSGEKKCHTVKALTLSNPTKRILYLNPGWVGKTHDYKMFQHEFPPQQKWFTNFKVRLDARLCWV